MHPLTASSGSTYTPAGRPRRGGQAQVWPAFAPNGAKVAVKVAHDPDDTSDRLRHEQRELARLLAAHAELGDVVVEVLDHGQDDGCAFLVLPWYDHDLHTWLQGRSLLDRARAAVASCRAVVALHRSALDFRRGVVHRDIKPKNMLVAGESDDGSLRLVLADFGGARRTIGGTATIGSGFHTRGYAPPDQALPRKAPPDRSWDVHALAVTVYECLVGRVPTGTMSASYAYRPEGHELLALAEQAARSTLVHSQQQRFDSLVNQPVRALVDVGGIEPITEADAEALEHTLQGAPGLARERAEMLADDLIDALRDALATDPSERQSDARPLLKVCQRLVRRVRRARDGAAAQREARSGPVDLVGMSVALPSRPPPTAALSDELDDPESEETPVSLLDQQTTIRQIPPSRRRPPPLPTPTPTPTPTPALSLPPAARPVAPQAPRRSEPASSFATSGRTAAAPPSNPPAPPPTQAAPPPTQTAQPPTQPAPPTTQAVPPTPVPSPAPQPAVPGAGVLASSSDSRRSRRLLAGLLGVAALVGAVVLGFNVVGGEEPPAELEHRADDVAVLGDFDEPPEPTAEELEPAPRPRKSRSSTPSSKKTKPKSKPTTTPTKTAEPSAAPPKQSRPEPAAEASPSATATLTVKTEPAGASVLVDGASAGRTPLDTTVPVGKHTLVIKLAGHESVRYPVPVSENGVNIKVKLKQLAGQGAQDNSEARSGTVKFVGDKRTVVKLGHRKLGAVPFSTTLPEGEHRFTIVPPGNGQARAETMHIQFEGDRPVIVPISNDG